MRYIAALIVACTCWGQVRPVRLDELPEVLQTPGWLAAINESTAKRVRDGEWDHVVFYALQASHFTKLPPIEPAVSAKLWKQAGRIPADASLRLAAFLAAPPQDDRHRLMRKMVSNPAELRTEYERAMGFLYEKEWASQSRDGAARRDHVATLYQTRGHSTDTELRSTYGVHIGLSTLKSLDTQRPIRRVLLIGPGLNWAPRTGFRDDEQPQSYQPYALADSLIRLGLSRAGQVSIDCVDVNPRVVEHINVFPDTPRRLVLHYPPGDEEWRGYFDGLGQSTGRRGSREIEVGRDIAKRIRAIRMNVLTERAESGAYDLAVATNVLLYFNDRELGLALSNVAYALSAGGHLIHNDLRPAVEEWGRELAIPIIHARTVRLDPVRELYDGVVLHENRR